MTPVEFKFVVLLALFVLGILAVIAIIVGSFWLNKTLGRLFNSEGNVIAKVLLFLPWIAIAIWCAALYVVGAIITLGLTISIANDVRNWWHKGH